MLITPSPTMHLSKLDQTHEVAMIGACINCVWCSIHSCQTSAGRPAWNVWDTPGIWPCIQEYLILSWNPARMHKWECGMSINSVHYIYHISGWLVGVVVHDCPKVCSQPKMHVGMVQKFSHVLCACSFYFWDSLAIVLATMSTCISDQSHRLIYNSLV